MRVLLSVRPSGATSNPFVDIFEQNLPDRISLQRFSYRRALFSRYEIFHVQWPEYIFRGSTLSKSVVKFAIGVLLLLRLAILRVPIVLTVHNIAAHERARLGERMLVAVLNRRALVHVFLNESAENDLARGIVLLHMNYPSVESGAHNAIPDAPRRLLFFGQIRPYKGIERLIQVVDEIGDGVSLCIAGLPIDAAYAARLSALAQLSTAPVTMRLEHLEETELDDLIDASDLVILPYRYMYNSGAVLKALSRGRRVLVPESGSTRTLAREVGEGWVTTFSAEVDVDSIEKALSGAPADSEPDLTRRDAARLGELQARLYEAVLASRSRSMRAWRRELRRLVRTDVGFTDHSALNRG